MSIVKVGIDGKKKVKVPCTACGGSGRILFVDNTAVEEPEITVELSDLSDGWRDQRHWSNIHYFKDGKPLCNLVRSEKAMLESKSVDDPEKAMCLSCSIRLKGIN
jgi:hypothetical protein